MEEALQQAIDSGTLQEAGVTLPLVEVDFTSFFPGTDKAESLRLLEPVGKVTSLQAPHRIVDAILRDSVVESKEGKRHFRAKAEKDESISVNVSGGCLRKTRPLYSSFALRPFSSECGTRLAPRAGSEPSLSGQWSARSSASTPARRENEQPN